MSYNYGNHMPNESSYPFNPSRLAAGAYGRNPRSQIARPVNPTPRSRTSSFSDAETTGSIPAPSGIKRSTSRGRRLSMLPRPGIGSTTSPATPIPTVTQKTTQPTPSVSSPEIDTPSVFVVGGQLPPPKRARNVLRRRAPTIGKHVKESDSNKLSLVIPQETQSPGMGNDSGYGSSKSLFSGNSASSYQANQKNESSVTVSSTSSKFQAPEELASLRTTIDTQNLPPFPTPFHSASSPSTRYSESPSIWSRGSTPTSLSSYSPGIVHSTKIGRLRQPSPSQTRLPFFAPATHASPRQEISDLKTQRRTPVANSSSGSSSAGTIRDQRIPTIKSGSNIPRGPPHSPPPRKSSVNFSPTRSPHIDVEKARREVEEAERRLFDPQGIIEYSSARSVQTPPTPPRPSRDGTHRLDLDTSPIIQSNLRSLKTTGHTRRESIEKVLATQQSRQTPSRSTGASVDSLQSRSMPRVSSREGESPVLSRKSPRTLVKEAPSQETDTKQIPPPKRFGIFPKKSKAADVSENTTEPARAPRKGPAAGTGHEGYGKYGQRGRKASASSSSGTRTRSTSTTRSTASKGSQSSRPEFGIDDFLMSRLEPVVINGGGLDRLTLSRTQSEQSISSMSVASSSNLARPPLSYSTGQSTDSLTTSVGTFGETITPSHSIEPARSRSPEHESNIGHSSTTSKPRMPVPRGKRHGLFTNPQAAVTSTSLPNHASGIIVPSKAKPDKKPQGKSTKVERAEKQHDKKEKPSMWNFLQKNRANAQKVPAPPATGSENTKLHAAITPVLNSQPVAHYAMVDADSDELNEIIDKVEDSPPTEEERSFNPVKVPRALEIRKRHPSVLLPSPPKMHGEFERDDSPSPRTAMLNRNLMPPELQTSPERRPRRLASIGRIPQVVSWRDRPHQPAIDSFSRPFSVAGSPSLTISTTKSLHESIPIANAPLDPGIEPSKLPEWGRGYNPSFGDSHHASALEFLSGPFSNYEFLQFPPKKGSTSSDSSGALAAVTALNPVPGSPPTEDEVWNEYDDLIDHVLSPDEPKPEESDKADAADRFELATRASRTLQDELNNANDLQSAPGATSVRSSGSSVHLRRSRIVSALQSSTAPSSQPSYTDLAARYGGLIEEKSDHLPTEQSSETDQRREKQSNFLSSLAAVPSPRPKLRREQESSSSEREWDAVTRTNMRSASLMTSRWLSFGRVLFSPAHNHVKPGGQGRILVIDGLGNDDWSFYCSLTYPDAEVYSLGGRPVSAAPPHPAAWQPPTNHHTVYHMGLGNPLPFPKDYFTVAVLRFPTVCSETVQCNVIQECKRVLRTGGYLEMSLLDRDMLNMGPRTRKAVRQLKEVTCLSDPTLSLKPTSDSVQRELGANGFDSLRRCMVRIPVAGMVLRSSDTSSSNQSTSATTPSTGFSLPTISVTTAEASQSTSTTSKSPSNEANISLGDLLSDPSPSPANDESIAKIVARVGRWWYSKCYEDPVFSAGDIERSIWNDRKVLRECQKRGTGFRMFVAYAQKPSEVPRRTASV
ncbi:uncharacterized protein N7515_005862 [Penicillium bovifimosum]|uniref:Methyltransferase type 11 domain-containing protein n=1 Tax=Penicillium bovifimosum TaxID=126998 RepID=A0A9W9GTW4_9EURO|nr:uncharacterized protein N7515_005862 [Penicillium bovifimosum]KAJ5129823.1 hypothetical protein N7515_005862 [Penicillium bovifimosum]